MKFLRTVVSALAVLVGTAAFSAAAAERPSNSTGSQRGEPRVAQFRGVTPGQTTPTALANDPQWGEPASRDSLPGDLTLLRYQVSNFPMVIAVRDGVVRSLDVLFPGGATVDEAVKVFALKDPLPEGPLPPAARIGEPIPEGLKARQFGSRRVVLFVEKGAGHPIAKRVRFYGPDDDLAALQGTWETVNTDADGKVVRRLVKEVRGNHEKVSNYGASGEVIVIKENDFSLERRGDLRVFRFYGGRVLAPPDVKGRTFQGEYAYRFEDDRFIEMGGKPGDKPSYVLVWTRRR